MILIVDDASDDVELVKAMLTSNGFDVQTASDGKEGLAKVRSQPPKLIISDVLMPEMDGFAFFKELKKDPKTSQIPVLILTVRGRMKDTFEAFGVESFMSKPFDAQTLFSIVTKYITPASVKQPENAPAVKVSETPSAAKPAVAKPAVPSVSATTAKKKAIIFGSDDHAMENMVRLLEKEQCFAAVIKDEAQLPVQVDSLEPDLILLQLNSHASMPIDETVHLLNELIHKKRKPVKPGNAGKPGASAAPEIGNIVIFKVDEEVKGMDSATASLADMDSLLDRCTEGGCKKYIGSFFPGLFINKIKEFIV